MTDEPVPPTWSDEPWNLSARWRFSKFYLSTLFDGHLHLVRRGADFPAHWADEDIARRLRKAAWWRKTTIRLSPCPQGFWVQSADDKLGLEGDPQLRDAHARALTENAALKAENIQLKEQVWKLRNP